MIVRPATYFDASAIFHLLLLMHHEAPINLPPVNGAKSMRGIINTLEGGHAFVTEDNGTLAGSIGGDISQDWYSESLFLADKWFFVPKDYRKSRSALLLLKAFKEHKTELGLQVLRMGVFNGEDVGRKDRFFEKAGFLKVGGLYVEGM